MKKSSIVAIVAVVILILAGLGILYYQSRSYPTPTPSPTSTPNPTPTPTTSVQEPPVTPEEGLIVNTPKAYALVASPLIVSGYVDGKNRWTGFEAQVGVVQLLDGNGKLLATGILTATDEDWMKFPINFSTTLTFSTPTTSHGTLVFRNENASGLPEYDREFRLPVKFFVSAQTVKLQAYFSNNNLDPAVSCEKVFPVAREVPKTAAVARAALEELLKGPTNAEKNAGYQTIINPGVKINSLTIDNGVAKVDFNAALQAGVAGSCKVTMIRAQITNTLKQFSTVKSVLISINGNSEDILQP